VKFTSFLPAISMQASPRSAVKSAGGGCTARVPSPMTDIAKKINPIVRGWNQYYGAFYRSALCPSLARINAYLVRWLRKKYKRLWSYTCASCRSKALLGTRHLRWNPVASERATRSMRTHS
jgi:RNA-directed DNA polymerase